MFLCQVEAKGKSYTRVRTIPSEFNEGPLLGFLRETGKSQPIGSFPSTSGSMLPQAWAIQKGAQIRSQEGCMEITPLRALHPLAERWDQSEMRPWCGTREVKPQVSHRFHSSWRFLGFNGEKSSHMATTVVQNEVSLLRLIKESVYFDDIKIV